MTVNIKNDIPEPFREFLDGGGQKEQEISATSINTDSISERSRDMQDLLFLAAILLLCDD